MSNWATERPTARDAANAAEDALQLQRDQAHESYRPIQPEKIELWSVGSGMARFLQGSITVPRDYRIRATRHSLLGPPATDITLPGLICANQPTPFEVERWPDDGGPAHAQVIDHIRFRFWPPAGTDWSCPCGKPDTEGHWTWRVPVGRPPNSPRVH